MSRHLELVVSDDRHHLSAADSATTWHREADAMLDAGVRLRHVASSLPKDSVVATDIRAAADAWLACARLRGRTVTLGGVTS